MSFYAKTLDNLVPLKVDKVKALGKKRLPSVQGP